jgi:excinuclease ABC subunit A
MQVLSSLARAYDFDLHVAWKDLPEEARDVILHGTHGRAVTLKFIDGRRSYEVKKPFEGVLGNLNRRMQSTESAWMREELARYRALQPCPDCGGTRLRTEARHVFLEAAGGDKSSRRAIFEVERATLAEAKAYFDDLKLEGAKAGIADKLVREIGARLAFLNDVGLTYLSLERSADSLSGGEAQRIRLASQIGSGLTGVMYVLDEPSIGLHQRDNERLVGTLEHLRDLGNSVLVVEHDEDMIRAADHVIDMGPGAGEHGGQVVAEGTPPKVQRSKKSITGQFLAGTRSRSMARRRAGTGICRRPARYWPVSECGARRMSSGVPSATTCPPCSPAPGPMSTM